MCQKYANNWPVSMIHVIPGGDANQAFRSPFGCPYFLLYICSKNDTKSAYSSSSSYLNR